MWQNRAHEERIAKRRLRYWEKRAPFGNTAPHLMRAAEEIRGDVGPAWATPNSMREISLRS